MNEIIRRLRDLLVGADFTDGEARVIVQDSGIDALSVWWSSDPEVFWQTVLNRAHTSWRMENLFAAADQKFGSNPIWSAAKQDYRSAREESNRQQSSNDDKSILPVDLAFGAKRLSSLKDALEAIQPGIFCDSRVRDERLDTASKELLSVEPIIRMLKSAAQNEGKQPLRHDLQRLADLLAEHYESVSQDLRKLDETGSAETASEPFGDLARHRASLLSTYEQALSFAN